MSKKLEAYCLKTKQKEEMVESEIVKTKRGGYMAKGVSKDGHKMSLMMSESTAMEAIKSGAAKQSF